ncbi:MAG: NAD-dependent epimerase/dehydratase family protein, partial [Acidimicrobiales bacterium]
LALLGERLVEARRRVADTLSSPASRSESLRHAAAEAAVLGDGPLEERDLGRVVVLGSDGPLGAVTLAALRQQSGIGDVLGAAGQAGSIAGGAVPELGVEDLELLLQGVATVVQLPRPTAPRTDTRQLWRRDVEGTRRLLEAMRRAGVDRLVHVSSAAAYSPAPEGSQVTEDWPTDGDPRSPTSLRLAYVERMLDGFEQERSARRVVRLRPAVVLGRSPALALWRSLPAPVRASRWVRPSSSPLVPVVSGLRLQVVGARDVARACCLALAKDAVGAFNLATEPLLDAGELGRSLGAKVVPLPPVVANAVAWFAWRAGLAVGPHAVTSLTAVPMIDPGKAREQLGWVATTDSGQAIAEVLEALADGAG